MNGMCGIDLHYAPSGLGMLLTNEPRVQPWAIQSCRVAATVGPKGAKGKSPGQRPGLAAHRYSSVLWGPDSTRRRFAMSAKLEQAIKANPRVWVMAGDFSRNAATCDSPGQRPGLAAHRYSSALKGPDSRPRRFTERAKREQAIKANPRGGVMTDDLKPTLARCLSRNVASWDSPGQRPGYASTFHQALRAAQRLFRPFRAKDFFDHQTQGVALGYHSSPLWGCGRRAGVWRVNGRKSGWAT